MCTATLLADPMAAADSDVRAAGEAALAAGFTEASVWAHQIPALEGLGLRIAVVEAAMTWANADAGAASDEAVRLSCLASEHGASKIVAVCLEPELADIEVARRNLAVLVDAAANAGAQVCVEFLPWTAIPDLATAWSLVEPLGPAAGILLDTWHWVRQPGGPAFDVLAKIPGERVGYVQLCDAAPTPPPEVEVYADAMANRLLPGEGVVDFAAVFAALDAIGAAPFIATEIFNPSIVVERGALGAATTMRDAAARVAPGR